MPNTLAIDPIGYVLPARAFSKMCSHSRGNLGTVDEDVTDADE